MQIISRIFLIIAVGLAAAWQSEATAQTSVQLEALKRLKNLDIEANPSLKNVQDNFLERRIRLDIEILQPLERLQLDACLGGRFAWPSGGQSNCDD